MPSKIFISYRRSDSTISANRLREVLEKVFEEDCVFMDTDDIKAGEKWEEKIKNAMHDTNVVLLLIGKNFFTIPGGEIARKIGDKYDGVYNELITAKNLGKNVIPVLVDHATIPNPELLDTMPEFIRDAFKNQCATFDINANPDDDVVKLINCFDLDLRFRYTVNQKHRYKIENLVGQGSTANVYWAFDQTLERDVAIKVVKEEYEKEFEKALKGAMTLATNAPNSVQIYDAYFDQKPFHAVMNYLGKNSLRLLIENAKSDQKIIDVGKVRDYISQIADALKNAHNAGVTHCNIKPSNILKGENDVAYLSPLNMLSADDVSEYKMRKRFFADENNSDSIRYKEDLNYIAPEILGDKNEFSFEDRKKIDQYMLGMLGYELLTGCMPVTAVSFDDLKKRSAEIFQNITKAIDIRQDCPQEFSEIIITMLSEDPDDRFASMNVVFQKLSEIAFDNVEIAKASYIRCLVNKREGPGFIESFYNSFINASEQAKKMFEERFKEKDGKEQQFKKMKSSIIHLLSFAKENSRLDKPQEPNSLSWIAEHHQSENILPASYRQFKNTLIETILQFDEQCKTSALKKIRAAWEDVLSDGINYMTGNGREVL